MVELRDQGKGREETFRGCVLKKLDQSSRKALTYYNQKDSLVRDSLEIIPFISGLRKLMFMYSKHQAMGHAAVSFTFTATCILFVLL